MTQSERRIYLINELLSELPQYHNLAVPNSAEEQKKMLRSLVNIRPPKPISDEFLRVQDEYLQTEIAADGITDIDALKPICGDIYIRVGDITTLKCDAVVNAANSQMLGCFCPCHGCIDNAIHTFSGVQLRARCAEIMELQGHDEPVGSAKITPAYNLPCKFVIHTVGPTVHGRLSKNDERQLADCYRSCLEIAEKNDVKSIAFCCISTGVFRFPNERAGQIAVDTVMKFKQETHSKMKVVFNVFKEIDYEIYRELLG